MNHTSRVYASSGNTHLLDLLTFAPNQVLDIGCGAGGNAILVKSLFANTNVTGITYSAEEAAIARCYMSECWVMDIEGDIPAELAKCTFDVLIFSHVLEHLRDPSIVLHSFCKLLCKGGKVLIAVPNVLSWRMRFQFLMGQFDYSSGGVLDDTHLRFFTYFSAVKLLLALTPDLTIETTSVTGNVPLWWFRRYLLPHSWSEKIDQWGCKHWPNLFGDQIIISAIKGST